MDYRKLAALLVIADTSFQRQRERPGQEAEDHEKQISGSVKKRRAGRKAARKARRKRKKRKGKK